MPRKFSQGAMVHIVLASLLAFNNAEADPISYVWSTPTSGFLFSADPVALKIITGQTPFAVGGTFIVFGSGSGTFTYDSNVPPPIQLPGPGEFLLFSGPSTAWSASLFGDAGLIGTFTGVVGVATFRNADESSGIGDVLNVQCCGNTGIGYTIGPYTATGSGVIWTGGQFLVGQTLPLTLPPPDGSNLQIAGFSFFNPNAPTIGQRNVFIGAFGLEIRKSIAIDIKPGSDPNVIEFDDDICGDDDDSRLKVAILTAGEFDAVQVDASTVQIGDPALSGTAEPIRSRVRDTDGDADLLLKFSLCDLVANDALNADTIELVLTGETFDGSQITGSDSVSVLRDDDDDDDDDDSDSE